MTLGSCIANSELRLMFVLEEQPNEYQRKSYSPVNRFVKPNPLVLKAVLINVDQKTHRDVPQGLLMALNFHVVASVSLIQVNPNDPLDTDSMICCKEMLGGSTVSAFDQQNRAVFKNLFISSSNNPSTTLVNGVSNTLPALQKNVPSFVFLFTVDIYQHNNSAVGVRHQRKFIYSDVFKLHSRAKINRKSVSLFDSGSTTLTSVSNNNSSTKEEEEKEEYSTGPSSQESVAPTAQSVNRVAVDASPLEILTILATVCQMKTEKIHQTEDVPMLDKVDK